MTGHRLWARPEENNGNENVQQFFTHREKEEIYGKRKPLLLPGISGSQKLRPEMAETRERLKKNKKKFIFIFLAFSFLLNHLCHLFPAVAGPRQFINGLCHLCSLWPGRKLKREERRCSGYPSRQSPGQFFFPMSLPL